jgi:hypothetical protein
MKRLRLSLEALGAKEESAPGPERKKIESLTKEVNEFLQVIHADKSKGAHNFVYASQLISEAEEKVLAIEKTSPQKVGRMDPR